MGRFSTSVREAYIAELEAEAAHRAAARAACGPFNPAAAIEASAKPAKKAKKVA